MAADCTYSVTWSGLAEVGGGSRARVRHLLYSIDPDAMRFYPTTAAGAMRAAVACFIVLGVVLYQRYGSFVTRSDTAVTAQNLAAATGTMRSLLVDIETNTLLYVITGGESYLPPYAAAVRQLVDKMAEVEALASDAGQEARFLELEDLVTRMLERAGQLVQVRRADGFAAARQAAETEAGRGTAARIRETSLAMVTDAQRLADQARAASQNSLRTIRWLMMLSFGLAIAMLLFAGVRNSRELRRRHDAERALRHAFGEVEARVHQRTAELVAANSSLGESEHKFRVMAELSPVFLFTTDADGRVTYLSPGFQSFLGSSARRGLEPAWASTLHADDRAATLTAWSQSVRQATEFNAECRLRGLDGTPCWFRARAVPVLGADGAATQWVGAAIDIHEQRNALAAGGEALRREQAARADAELVNRLRDTFLATVSHELRTPLNAIVGWIHLMRAGAVPDQARALEAIERNAALQTRLIEDLLDASRMIKGAVSLTMAPLDLRVLALGVASAIEPTADAKKVALRIAAGDAPVPVWGDQARLQQVVWNLLSNAVKFTPSGGRVDVEVSADSVSARLTVRDSGEGIDPGFLPHVFEPFRQGSSRGRRVGLGLGLAIVWEVVALHGGSVAAASGGSDQGTCFTVQLPLATAGAAASVPHAPDGALAGVRVVLAEDNRDAALIVSTILGQRGCDVRTASSGHECLEVLDRWVPDVLIFDVGLPDQTGYALLARVRQRTALRDVPAIALSAFGRGQAARDALEHGFAAYVPKPLDPERLVREINRALPEGRPRRNRPPDEGAAEPGAGPSGSGAASHAEG
jgi:PAS domain S-box-containing protein